MWDPPTSARHDRCRSNLVRPARRRLDRHSRTLHRWAQIMGKMSLALRLRLNQWWQAPFCVMLRDLTTGPVLSAAGSFEVLFDFRAYRLRLFINTGANTGWDCDRSR